MAQHALERVRQIALEFPEVIGIYLDTKGRLAVNWPEIMARISAPE